MELLTNCVRFREMLFAFTRRELRQRYVGSVLGRAWPVLQPLLLLGLYYLVFVQLLDQKLDPTWIQELAGGLGLAADEELGKSFNVVLLCCGLVPWLVTAEYTMRSSGVVVENGSLVKKVRFPSELLPISLLLSYLVNLVILLGIFCTLCWTLTPFRSELWWMLPIVVLLQALFLLGIAYLTATANVFVRDVGQLLPLLVNVWFFLTPVVFVREQLKPGLTWIFDWNPMAYVVDLYRWMLIFPERIRYTRGPDGANEFVTMERIWGHIGIFGGVAAVVFVVGYLTFMANKHKFADEV
jgi:ABC-type polysaccharide/polyol phosphate export permease